MGDKADLQILRFQSILSGEPDDGLDGKVAQVPDFFGDLNLDRVVDAITADWKDYNLKPFYHARLSDLDAIAYRQEIFQDLEEKGLIPSIKSFSERMRVMRARLKEADEAKRLDYKYAMERLFLGAAQTYCEAIEKLWGELCGPDLSSRGLRAFREYLGEYIESSSFRGLAAEARKVNSDLSAITYGLLLKDGSVTVRLYEEEADYSAWVERIFDLGYAHSGHPERRWRSVDVLQS